MNSFWSKGERSDSASGNTNQPPGSFSGASFDGTSQNPSVYPQGEDPNDNEPRKWVQGQGNNVLYPGQRPQIDIPPQSGDIRSSVYTRYTQPDPSQLAPTGTTGIHSLGRSDTMASRDTQHTAAPSLSALSQPAKPRPGEVWDLGTNAPVLPDYRGIPVESGTTNYHPGEVNGKTWHSEWKLRLLNDGEKKFVDGWSSLTEQCGCGFGKHLPVQKNICKDNFILHINNARTGLRILKQQFFTDSENVTVAAWDKVLDTSNTFSKSARSEYIIVTRLYRTHACSPPTSLH
jgi:hypothetical protein